MTGMGMKQQTLTPFLQRALSLVAMDETIYAAEMASRLWPDSPAWKRVSNVGNNGAAHGVAIKRRGGNVCWALWKLGYFMRDGYGFKRIR